MRAGAGRGCWSAVAGRRAARRPIGRGCSRCAAMFVRPSARPCEPNSAPGRQSSLSCCPSSRELFPALPEPPMLESRVRAFGSSRRSSFLRRAAEAQPLVLVLDDLHAADEPSLLLLRFLAREIADSPLLVVCATATSTRRCAIRWPRHSPSWRASRTPLRSRSPGSRARRRRIHRAGDRDRAVDDPRPGDPHRDRRQPVVRGGGRASPGRRAPDRRGRRGRPDPGGSAGRDRSAAATAVRAMPQPARRASVMGREFGMDALARLGDDTLLDLLDEAMAERVVSDVPGSPGRLRFGHALIRDTLYDELTGPRRSRLHQQRRRGARGGPRRRSRTPPCRAGAALLRRGAGRGGRQGDRLRAPRRRSGGTQLAYEEAARHYEMALTLVHEPSARCELLLALGDTRARAGDMRASKDAFHEAAELAERHDLSEHLARAALGYGGRISGRSQGTTSGCFAPRARARRARTRRQRAPRAAPRPPRRRPTARLQLPA